MTNKQKGMEGVGVGRLHITETVFCRLQPSQPSLRLFGVGQFYIAQLVFKSLQNMSVMIYSRCKLGGISFSHPCGHD